MILIIFTVNYQRYERLYNEIECIGSGSYGTVVLVRDRYETDGKYAVKKVGLEGNINGLI